MSKKINLKDQLRLIVEELHPFEEMPMIDRVDYQIAQDFLLQLTQESHLKNIELERIDAFINKRLQEKVVN